MKRLNRKGFTLVELLAVIIILAIVVGITIPAVLTMVDNAKRKAGKDAADVVADWVDKQYGLVSIGFSDSIDANFTNASACGTGGSACVGSGKDITYEAFIIAAGLKTTDVASINVAINSSTGRSCITITPASSGNFYVNGDGTEQVHVGGICASTP